MIRLGPCLFRSSRVWEHIDEPVNSLLLPDHELKSDPESEGDRRVRALL